LTNLGSLAAENGRPTHHRTAPNPTTNRPCLGNHPGASRSQDGRDSPSGGFSHRTAV
jgi:hypothetical protein